MAIPTMAPAERLRPGEAGIVDAQYVHAEDVDVEDWIAEDVITKDDRFEKEDAVGCDVAVVASEPVQVDPDS